MKKLVILTLILAAGLTAYPQSSTRSRESKSKAKSSVSRSSSKSSNSKSRSATVKPSSSSRSKATPNRSKTSQSRSKAIQSRSSKANRSASQSQSRQSSARSGSAQKSRSQSSSRKPAVRSSSSSSRSSASKSKAGKSSAGRSSASRSNRSGKSTYERNDGQKFRHDNNKVFATRKYKVDFKSTADLRNSNDYRRVYNDYNRWSNNRYRRRIVVRNYYYHAPLSLEIRRVRYPYRRPVHIDLCWTPWLHQRFIYYYPMHNNWNNNRYGNYIESISSYDAMHYAGSVKRVYGKVEEVYYSQEDRTYTLYFGAPFPYHDFSVVIPKRIAKEISRSPTWHFEDEYVWVVGLVDVWENKAEIVVHDEDQIRRY